MSDNSNQIPISVTTRQTNTNLIGTNNNNNSNNNNNYLSGVDLNGNNSSNIKRLSTILSQPTQIEVNSNTNQNVKRLSTINLNSSNTNITNKPISNDRELELLELEDLDAFLNNQKTENFYIVTNSNDNDKEVQENKIRIRKPSRTSAVELAVTAPVTVITNSTLPTTIPIPTTTTATTTAMTSTNGVGSSGGGSGGGGGGGSSSNNNSGNADPNHKPPHHHHHHHHRHRHEASLLKELMQLSIKKEKIEKALAATGYQNSMDAINWLMKHSKDPFLNQDSVVATRDYILVLCPIGRLANQIGTFFQQSKLKCGVNEAHYNNLLPFMKLTPFFKMLDTDVITLHKAFDLIFRPSQPDNNQEQVQLINKRTRLNDISIDLHVSSQMILLYPDVDSENLIKEIVSAFSKLAFKLIKTDFEIVPYSKQLHLTLAYNFDPENKRCLEELAIQHIDYRSHSDWEVRLYSRDSRAESKYTYKVIAPYKPKAENELYLKANDYVYSSAMNANKDTYIKGISFTTGESGFFPAKNVERSNETDTWKMHKSYLFVNNQLNNNNNPSSKQLQQTQPTPPQPQPPQPHVNANQNDHHPPQRTTSLTEKNRISLQVEQQQQPKVNNTISHSSSNTNGSTVANNASISGNGSFNPFYSENSFMQKKFQSNPLRSMQTSGALRFFFVRHGERIDLAFGPQWIEQSYDRNGKYRRINLNMPNDLPNRPNKREFIGDSPLTEVGKFQARLTGEALGTEGYKLYYCYSSPALRCIQTAHQILQAQGLENLVKIRIEPSVFEFLGWYDKGLPTFLGYESLVQFGYNIDIHYRPLLPLERLQADESYTDYYQRSFNITKYLTNLHQNEGANILVVGHAGTLEVCTRQICGLPVRSYSEFNSTIRKVPYLGICLLEKDASSQIFEIQPAPIPPIGHTANFNFDPASLKT